MPRESKKARIARMHQEYEQLCVEIPDPKCALNFNSPFELLVATVLSAQTTDKRVNMVTPELFGEYPGPAELDTGLSMGRCRRKTQRRISGKPAPWPWQTTAAQTCS